MAGTYIKTNATDVADLLSIIISRLLLAGWTNAGGSIPIAKENAIPPEEGPPGLPWLPELLPEPDNGKHMFMNSPGGKCMISMCTGYRGEAQEGADSAILHPGTPYKIPDFRYDSDKSGHPTTRTGWNWKVKNRWHTNPPETTPMYEASWIAMNMANHDSYWGGELWFNQVGKPIWNGNTDEGVSVMNTFEGDQGVGMGPSIPDVWIITHEDPHTVFIVTKKITNNNTVVYQHMYFGETINKCQDFSGGQFFNASILSHDPNRHTSESFDSRGQGLTAGYITNNLAKIAQRDTSKTFIKVDDSAFPNESDCTGSDTNYWGTGSGNICTGPTSGPFSRSVTNGAMQIPWLPTGVFEAYQEAESPTPAWGWDTKRGYSRIEEVLCYRRIGADALGGTLLGTLPHCGLTSTEVYNGADEIMVDGDPYLIFPFHVRSIPWDRKSDAAGTLGKNNRDWNARGCNHFGVGFAIRKPL